MSPLAVGRADRRVLLIDDDPRHAEAFEEALRASAEGGTLQWVRTLSSGLEKLADQRVWAIFLNVALPDSRGLDTVDAVLSVNTATPIVVLAGADGEALCTAAMARGAQDYLLEGHLDSYAFARAMRNIGEREIARHELFVEKERAQVTLNSIGDAVLSTDTSGHVTYLNLVAEQMTGWSTKEAMGRPLTDVFNIIDGVTREPAPDPLELAIRLDKAVGLSANCLLIRRDGYETAIEDSSAPIHDREGQITGAVIVFHDVNMARGRVLEMSHRAQHDALTELPNRFLLNDRLIQALLRAQRNGTEIAVLFLDLDGFKRINDSRGHLLGDNILHAVAARLCACVRKSDTVSRYGGDEFVILLPDIAHAADGAAITGAKIIAALNQPFSVGEHQLRVTASIGISSYPVDGADALTLIKRADTAMYHAKQRGSGALRADVPAASNLVASD